MSLRVCGGYVWRWRAMETPSCPCCCCCCCCCGRRCGNFLWREGRRQSCCGCGGWSWSGQCCCCCCWRHCGNFLWWEGRRQSCCGCGGWSWGGQCCCCCRCCVV